LVFVRMKSEGEGVKLCPNCLCIRLGALVEARMAYAQELLAILSMSK
jgi:hypothetical protein